MKLKLQELGPEYRCFALYLSSRADLLPAEYCHELALIPDSEAALSPEVVHHILEREFGDVAKQPFAEFDYLPKRSALLTQHHRAKLRTGARVEVVLLRPLLYAFHERQDDGFLGMSGIEELWDELTVLDVFADFDTAMRRKTSLLHTREGMEMLARDAASGETLRSHLSYFELCSRNVLIFEPGESQPLDAAVIRARRGADTLARRICHVWLQQALHGRCFPVDPRIENIHLGEDGRISFLHCELAALPAGARENLTGYLHAILAADPDKAMMYLLREMRTRSGRRIDNDSLRSNFRQAAYFGMLEPILGTNSNAIAQLVFQHCRTAREHHYSPGPDLLCFYRGLLSIARAAWQICEGGDPLREGLEEIRACGAFDQMREIMDWRYWQRNSDKFAAAMVHLPRIFDDALTKASSATPDSVPHEPPPASRTRASTDNLILLVVLLIAFSQLPQTHEWRGRIVPLALMLIGLLALRNR
ncbi:MAG: AarF/UbiB family protein [Candidatus Angelobacter sp.]